jgi:hypothetical protein
MIGSLWVGRRGAPSKVRFDHVGDDGSRLGEIEGGDGRLHLVETLAAAQQFGIDRADLVEHLLQFAEVGEELGDLSISCIGHVAEPRAFAGSSDCGEISLGAVPRSIGAVAVGPAAAFVGLHQRTSDDLLDRGQVAHELVATLAQGCG